MKTLIYVLSGLLMVLPQVSFSAGDLLIKNARVFTLGTQGTIEEGDILIKDGRIEDVGEDIRAEGVTVINAKGRQITPGLINAYTHLAIEEISAVEETVDTRTEDTAYSASYNITPAINPRSSLLPHNLIHGLTGAVVAAGAGHHVIAGQGAAIRLGSTDHLIDGKAAMFIHYGGAAGRFAGGSRAAVYLKLDQALSDALEYRDNQQAILAGEWRDLSLPLHDLEALLPVANAGMPVVITANRASDIQMLLDLKAEYRLDMIIAGAAEAWMLAERIADAGVPLIIDPMANLPSNFDRLGARLDAATILHEGGVTLLFHGGGTHNAYQFRISAGNAAAYGLPATEALKAMTLNVAEAFGFADDYGSIEKGKVADLVIWDGDPLELLTLADQVIVDGEPVPMVSRSTRLRDRYRDLQGEPSFFYRR